MNDENGQQSEGTEVLAVSVLEEDAVVSQEANVQLQSDVKEVLPKWRAALDFAANVILCLGAALALIFTFLISCGVGVSVDEISLSAHVSIWEYFGPAFNATNNSFVSGSMPDKLVAVMFTPDALGVSVSALAVICVLTLAVLTVVALIKKFVFNKKANYAKYAFGTILAYLAGTAAFVALHAAKVDMVNVAVSPDGATVAGIVLCSLCLAAYTVCTKVSQTKAYSGADALKTGFAGFSVALAIVLLICAALPVFTITKSSARMSLSYNMTLSTVLQSGYKYYYADELVELAQYTVGGYVVQVALITSLACLLAFGLKTLSNKNNLSVLITSVVVFTLSLINLILNIYTIDKVDVFFGTDTDGFYDYQTPIVIVVFAFVNLALSVTGFLMHYKVKKFEN